MRLLSYSGALDPSRPRALQSAMPKRPKLVLPLKIVAPLVLGIVASLAIAVYSELGYRRLENANQRMAVALETQALVYEMMKLIVDAESGQRGYMLTGNEEYLAPYKAALPKIETTFAKLRELLVAQGTPDQRAAAARINALAGKKLAELEAAIALYSKDGLEAAFSLLNTGIGKRAMDDIRAEAEALVGAHRRQVDDASMRWVTDIEFARVGMRTMTAFTVALLLVVWLLARRDAQQREARRFREEDEKRRLEALVEQRTIELSELSNHLQIVREEEKSKLARDMHDELGGILVGAKMDVGWVEKRVSGRYPEAAEKLTRVLNALDDAVQIKRRIIEELRPTLLDNLGLAAALDWQVKEICSRAGLKCSITVPVDDTAIPPNAAIALYRIVQEALTNIVKYAQARHVNVELVVADGSLSLLIDDDGVGIPAGAQTNHLSHGIAGMRQRVRALHGEFTIGRRREGGTVIEVTIPLPAAPPVLAAPEPARA